MWLTREQAQVLFYGFSADFQRGFANLPLIWDGFATLAPSTTKNALYHFVDQLPSLRKWVGSRQKVNAALRDYTLKNEPYEQTVTVDKFDVADDIHNAYAGLFVAQGQAAARWPDEVMTAVVAAGNSTVCYDGQYFFDTDHPINMDDAGSSTYSNLLTSSSYDLSLDPLGVWQRASEKMAGFVGAGGAPLGLVADTLMVPPNLRRYAVQAAKAEIVPQTFTSTGTATQTNASAASVSNIYVGDFKVIVNPYMSQTAPYGVVMCTNRGINPFIWQLRQAPLFIPQTDPSLSAPFYDKEFVYGVEARGAGGYSLPFLAVRVAAS